MEKKRNLINVTEAAEYVYLSVYTLRTYVSQKKIPHYKIGSRVFFDPKQLDDWIEKKAVECSWT